MKIKILCILFLFSILINIQAKESKYTTDKMITEKTSIFLGIYDIDEIQNKFESKLINHSKYKKEDLLAVLRYDEKASSYSLYAVIPVGEQCDFEYDYDYKNIKFNIEGENVLLNGTRAIRFNADFSYDSTKHSMFTNVLLGRHKEILTINRFPFFYKKNKNSVIFILIFVPKNKKENTEQE